MSYNNRNNDRNSSRRTEDTKSLARRHSSAFYGKRGAYLDEMVGYIAGDVQSAQSRTVDTDHGKMTVCDVGIRVSMSDASVKRTFGKELVDSQYHNVQFRVSYWGRTGEAIVDSGIQVGQRAIALVTGMKVVTFERRNGDEGRNVTCTGRGFLALNSDPDPDGKSAFDVFGHNDRRSERNGDRERADRSERDRRRQSDDRRSYRNDDRDSDDRRGRNSDRGDDRYGNSDRDELYDDRRGDRYGSQGRDDSYYGGNTGFTELDDYDEDLPF